MSFIDVMKSEALNNGSIQLSKEEQDVKTILDGLSYAKLPIKEELKFIKHVRTRGTGGEHRVGLHASGLLEGDTRSFCLRKQVLSLIYKPREEKMFPKLRRTFDIGNSIHELWQKRFIAAGYSSILDCDKTQYDEKTRISFSPDIICKLPDLGKYVIEIKSANKANYSNFYIKGHKSAEKQLNVYLHLTGIKRGIILVDNKDNQEFFVKIIEYDKSKLKDVLCTVERINKPYDKFLETKKIIKRPEFAESKDCKHCKGCVYVEPCWDKSKRVKI